MIDGIETDGPTAPPRYNGELVFDAPWEGRAFGMCVAILDREGLTWDDFRPHLVAAIESRPDHGYYEQLAVALDDLVDSLGLLT